MTGSFRTLLNPPITSTRHYLSYAAELMSFIN